MAAQARSVLEAAKAHAEELKGASDATAVETLGAAARDAHRLRDRIDALAAPIADGLTVLRSERDRLAAELGAIYASIGNDEQLRIPAFEGTVDEDEEEFAGVDATVVEDGEEAEQAGEAEAAEPEAPGESEPAAAPEADGEVPPAPEVRPQRSAGRPGAMAGIAAPSNFLDLPSLDDEPDGAAGAAAAQCEHCDGTGTCRTCHGRGRVGILRRCVRCSATGRCLHCEGTGKAPAAA